MSDPKSQRFKELPRFLYFVDEVKVKCQSDASHDIYMRRAAVLSVDNGLKVIDVDDETRWFVFSYGK